MYGHNTSRRRSDRHKALPSGIPDVMFENLESIDALDFKVSQQVNGLCSCLYKLVIDNCPRISARGGRTSMGPTHRPHLRNHSCGL